MAENVDSEGFVPAAKLAEYFGSFNCYGLNDLGVGTTGTGALENQAEGVDPAPLIPVLGYLVSYTYNSVFTEEFVDAYTALSEIANLLGGDVRRPGYLCPAG